MKEKTQPKGWNKLVGNLRADLSKIAPGLHVTEIGVSDMGRLLFYYSASGLTTTQAAAVDARVKRAEDAAWQTCVVCGRLGNVAYTAPPPIARAFCKEHKPKDWNALDG